MENNLNIKILILINNLIMELNKYLAGGLSGIVEVILTHPLDYLKTKKQEYIQKNITTNFYKTLLQEKNLNIYKGVIPRILGVAPMRLTFWGVQDNVYSFYKRNNYNINNYQIGAIAGMYGGFFQTLIDNPIELLKVKHITNQKIKCKEFLKNQGFMPTLYRNIGFAICMSTFCLPNKTDNNLHNFALSSITGSIASILTQPLDYVKTLKQRIKTKDNTLQILINTIRENPRYLYIGGLNRNLLNFFGMGIGYVAYDNFYKLICND